jgi:hypothetical protein
VKMLVDSYYEGRIDLHLARHGASHRRAKNKIYRGGERGVRSLWKIVSVGCSPTRLPTISLENLFLTLSSLHYVVES